MGTYGLEVFGGSINIGNGNFIVDSDGNMTAKSGAFEGTVYANKLLGDVVRVITIGATAGAVNNLNTPVPEFRGVFGGHEGVGRTNMSMTALNGTHIYYAAIAHGSTIDGFVYFNDTLHTVISCMFSSIDEATNVLTSPALIGAFPGVNIINTANYGSYNTGTFTIPDINLTVRVGKGNFLVLDNQEIVLPEKNTTIRIVPIMNPSRLTPTELKSYSAMMASGKRGTINVVGYWPVETSGIRALLY